MTKICNQCGEEKELELFTKGVKYKHGRRNTCKKCLRDYTTTYYKNNPRKKKRVATANGSRLKVIRIKARRDLHTEYLRAYSCVDCGERDICVLEADHVDPRQKVVEISKLLQGSRKDLYLAERDKTRVLCVNCHRIHTYNQGDWGEIRRQNADFVGYSKAKHRESKRPISKLKTICWQCRNIKNPSVYVYCSKSCRMLARSALKRYCGICKRTLLQKEFKGKWPKCSDCRKDYVDLHYQKYTSEYLWNAKRQKRNRSVHNYSELLLYFANHHCIDCGESRPQVLEFDHRDGVKKDATISSKIKDWPWSRMLLEIAKCDVRCANCHRRRTHRQQKSWASKTACPDHLAPLE